MKKTYHVQQFWCGTFFHFWLDFGLKTKIRYHSIPQALALKVTVPKSNKLLQTLTNFWHCIFFWTDFFPKLFFSTNFANFCHFFANFETLPAPKRPPKLAKLPPKLPEVFFCKLCKCLQTVLQTLQICVLFIFVGLLFFVIVDCFCFACCYSLKCLPTVFKKFVLHLFEIYFFLKSYIFDHVYKVFHFVFDRVFQKHKLLAQTCFLVGLFFFCQVESATIKRTNELLRTCLFTKYSMIHVF